MNQNLLVTGGAGAMGSSLANHLTKDPNFIIDVVDNLASGYESNLHKKENLNFFVGSVLDDNLMSYLSKRDYAFIYHLAASVILRCPAPTDPVAGDEPASRPGLSTDGQDGV